MKNFNAKPPFPVPIVAYRYDAPCYYGFQVGWCCFSLIEYGKGNIKLNEAIDKIQNFKYKSNYNRIITIISDGDLVISQNVNSSIKNQLKNAQFFILGIGHTIDYRAMNYIALVRGEWFSLVMENDLLKFSSPFFAEISNCFG